MCSIIKPQPLHESTLHGFESAMEQDGSTYLLRYVSIFLLSRLFSVNSKCSNSSMVSKGLCFVPALPNVLSACVLTRQKNQRSVLDELGKGQPWQEPDCQS